MKTQRRVGLIVGGVALLALGFAVTLVVTLGWVAGLLVAAGSGAVVVLAYVTVIGPWQRRWGATSEEVRRIMPGDALVPGGAETTRSIGIEASPEAVWPWLLQIGYGRAGWYSYDWIDNDGLPSADRIVPELQGLRVGDRLEMMPGMGPVVRAIDPLRSIVAAGDADSWCLALYGQPDGTTRLVSRWRASWPRTLATFFWIVISDPGSFVMERRMLKGIKRRAERHAGAEGNGPIDEEVSDGQRYEVVGSHANAR